MEYPKFHSLTRAPNPPLPPKSCDCQVHVYGDPNRYPLRIGGAYRPPEDATFDMAKRIHQSLGFERGVVVQSTVHGLDHSILFDALKDQPNYRGVAIIDDTINDRELERMHDAGVRGARFNFWKTLNMAPTPAVFERSISRIAKLGWHAKIHAEGNEWLEIKDMLKKVDIPVVIDHMGHPHVARGLNDPEFLLILELLHNENWWILLSNGDRFSAKAFPWDDIVPFGEKLAAAAPDRAIWCSDWPRVRYEKPEMPKDADILELLYRYAPDPAQRRKILVDNPARLFGF